MNLHDHDTRRRILIAILLVIGTAMFESAKVVMLKGDAAGSLGATYTSRFVAIATFLIMAIVFHDHLPSLRNMQLIMVSFAGLYIVTLFVTNAMADAELAAIMHYAVGALYGVSTAVYFLLYALAFSSFGRRGCAVLFMTHVLILNCFMLVFTQLEPSASFIVRIVFLMCGVGILAWALHQLFGTAAQQYPVNSSNPPDHTSDGNPAPGQRATVGVTSQRSEPGNAPATRSALPFSKGRELPHSAEPSPHAFPATTMDWVALLLAGFLLSTIFGIVAQLGSEPGSAFALYDINTGAALLVIEILLIVLVCCAGNSLSFAMCFTISCGVCAISLLLYATGQPSLTFFAGLMMRTTLDCGSLFWILLAQKSCEHPQKTFLYFGAYRAVATVYIGRTVGLALQQAGSTAQLLMQTSIVGLFLLAMLALFVCILQSRGYLTLDVATQRAPAPGLSVATTDSPDVTDTYDARIASLADQLQLSKREREVMTELLHGQTRAGIADKLFISQDTVKYHISRIYLKAGVNSKQELLALLQTNDQPR